MKNDVNNVLIRLSYSKFRSSFHLPKYLKEYVKEKGLETIRVHAYDLIKKGIGDAYPKNDGKQTPTKNHPVFVAMHACACCCRSCLYKWHHIPKGRELAEDEIRYLVNLVMIWIEREAK